jgi:CRISPR-associated protein Cpf1
MIPKVAFAAKNRKTVGWTEEIQSVKDAYAKFQEKKLKDKTGSVAFPQKDLARLISYYQRALEVLTVENETCSYKEVFGLTWKDPEQYTSLADFNADVERNNYKISFVPLSGSYIDTLQARGDLYLFEIVNKDLSLVSDKLRTGSENMHTMYFRALMNPENSHVFKLDGEAEMFYRDAVDKEALGTKTDKEGKELVNSRGEKVIKGYRYSKAKWLLHLKMTLNKSAAGSGRPYEFNSGVIAALRSKDIPNESIRVIGIDRGEKHLAYYTVIDMNGHIYEAGSLNTIQVAGKDVDYHALLHARMKEREDNRRGWDVVREIKNLKKGWVGGAVHTIVALAEKYNAVIVLEDLSFRFKQIRSGVEKSTYQQLEKGLIDKCGYLVNKKSVANEPGGVLNGYQLAAPFESFEKLGKQTGFIFYVNAGYTSKIDPITGFRQTVYISPSDSTEKIREQFMKFDEISYSAKYQSFCFTYNTRQCLVSDKAKRAKNQSDVYEKTWKVHGKVHRVRRVYRDGVSEKHWSPELVVPDDMLHELFGQYGIDVQRSILDQIGDEEDAALQQRLLEKKASTFEPKARNFWERLAFIFNLICQVRNATTAEYLDGKVVGEDVDFIESPVYPFFATGGTVLGKRLHTNWAALDAKVEPGARHLIDKNEYNGDTNGAYNIARKGALLVEEKIRSNAVGVDTKKVNLAISNAEWDKWVDKMSDKTHTE